MHSSSRRAVVVATRAHMGSLFFGFALLGCASMPDDAAPIGEDSQAAVSGSGGAGGTGGSCKSSSLAVLDIHGDMREIWKGLEAPATGKQADPTPVVTLDFNASVQAASIGASFVPVSGASCGAAVPATAGTALVPLEVWGQLSSDAARPVVPSPYNVLARDGISGIVSAGGPIAAGKDVTLSSVSVNGTVRQPVGLIAGGKVVLNSGSVAGDVTYGVASTFPGTVTVSGRKSLLPFDPVASFQKLEALSTLLDAMPTTGTATLANGTLTLAGNKAGTNVIRVTADQLRQATSINISAPSGSGVLIGVSGSSVDLQNKGLWLTGVSPAAILWNLSGAATVSVNAIGLQGAVLAPRATVNFGNGSINGTVVARSFVGSGSGTLQHTGLNVALLLGSSAPSAIDLKPATPLARGCTYRLTIPSTRVLTPGGACLGTPFDVTFQVAPHPSTAVTRELEHVELDRATNTLRRFIARDGVNTRVEDIWKRYMPLPGVSSAELLPVGPLTTSSANAAHRVQAYQQYAQGYPVFGQGYFVSSQDGLFRGANGHVVPSIPSVPAPAVSASTALANALTHLQVSPAPWVSQPSLYRAPVGALGLVPRKVVPGANDFSLAWVFEFGPTTGIGKSADIQIDAATGSVLRNEPDERSIGMNPAAQYVQPDPFQMADVVDFGLQQFTGARYRNPDGTLVTTLANGDVSGRGTLATATGRYRDPQTGNLAGTASYQLDPTPNTPWSIDEPEEQNMAGAQWALERTAEFMKTSGIRLNGLNWTTVDGVGRQRVVLNYLDPLQAPVDPDAAYIPRYSGVDEALIFWWRTNVSISIVPHEYAHALLHNARKAMGLGLLAYRRESGAIDEGFADSFAIAFNQQHANLPGPWYCLLHSQTGSGSVCLRDMAIPANGLSPTGPQPNYYKGQHYQDFTNAPQQTCEQGSTDRCGVHHNSTVISHWSYLLGAGSIGLPSVPCDLKLSPVDSGNTATGLRLAVQLLLSGIQQVGTLAPGPEVTFADLRDATLRVAEEGRRSGLYTADQVSKVELAWAAVGVPPQQWGHGNVEPPDGAKSVDPWVTFAWPVDGSLSGSRWDFQIAEEGPFDTHLKYELNDVTTVVNRNGVPMATVSVSLPYDSASRFYWRVRPHSNDPNWLACYPVHVIVGTKRPKPVENLKVTSEVENGRITLPANFEWDVVPGATKYALYASTDDPNCTAGPGVLQEEFDPNIEDPTDPVIDGIAHLDAAEHYFVNVQALGPPGFDGNEAPGDCAKIELDTGLPTAPVLESPPLDNAFWDDSVPVEVGFSVPSGTAQTELNFYELDENGNCGSQSVATVLDVEPCHTFRCARTASPSFTVLNLSGYCWDAVSFATNGTPSERSERWKFQFYHLGTVPITPGVHAGFFDQGTTWTLPGFAGDTDVKLEWEPDPYALGYGYRVWPYARDAAPFPIEVRDPWNCFGSGSNCSLRYEETAACKPPGCVIDEPHIQLIEGLASAGRYCWDVWPVFASAGDPNEIGARQPFLRLDYPFCYTSGPTKPRITIENPPGSEFTGAVIRGQIAFDYVPDGQYAFTAVDPDTGQGERSVVFGEACALEAPFVYSDVHDCAVSFEIHTTRREKYLIVARTWNSDQHPPIKNESTQLEDVTSLVEMPSCGFDHEWCCRPETGLTPCDDPRTECDPHSNTCEACGELGQTCCMYRRSGPNGDRQDLDCPGTSERLGCDLSTRRCERCGANGQACCYSRDTELYSCDDGRCNLELECGGCGVRGARCCLEQPGTPACGDNLECVADGTGDLRCQPTCGLEGGVCCGTSPRCFDALTCDDGTNLCRKAVCRTLPTPSLQPPEVTGYQAFCNAVPDSQVFVAPDLTIGGCELTKDVNELVATGSVPTSTGLALAWPPMSDAHHYEVFVLDYPGWNPVWSTTVGADIANVAVPNCTGQITTHCLPVVSREDGHRIYSLVVRAVAACGVKGSAAIGMMAVSAPPI